MPPSRHCTGTGARGVARARTLGWDLTRFLAVRRGPDHGGSEWLGGVGSETARALLHTSYHAVTKPATSVVLATQW